MRIEIRSDEYSVMSEPEAFKKALDKYKDFLYEKEDNYAFFALGAKLVEKRYVDYEYGDYPYIVYTFEMMEDGQ